MRSLSHSLALGMAVLSLVACSKNPPPHLESAAEPATDWTRKSIAQLQAALENGSTTSLDLVRAYKRRIDKLNDSGPALNAVIIVNPDAEKLAAELDAERKQHGARGPLHGIPVLLKDNIESLDKMPTTAGSLALIDNFSTRDAPIAAQLRAAGAIILGKTNLSEWANFRSTHSISGWSAKGGLAKNPHVLDRSACGSSSGSGAATAAFFAAASVGTETDGSITCPSSMNGLVGLKPTLGLLPQDGIVPISHSQDTAGPMTRTVSDAAYLLSAMIGPQSQCQPEPSCRTVRYTEALKDDALRGKRIGIWRFRTGSAPSIDPIYERALKALRDAGATLIELPTFNTEQIDAAEEVVLFTEFKHDINRYLASTPAAVKHRTLDALIEFNKNNKRELSVFGQEIFERSNSTKGIDDPAYKAAVVAAKRLAGPEGIDRILASEKLDFIVAPTTGPAWRVDSVNGDHYGGSFTTVPAVAGYPHLTVPMGDVRGLPVGISFIGAKWSEALLLAVGFAFEQRMQLKLEPRFIASIDTAADLETLAQ